MELKTAVEKQGEKTVYDAVKSVASQNGVCLVVVPGEKYRETQVELAKSLSTRKVIYISTESSCEVIIGDFRKAGVKAQNFTFIDASGATYYREGKNSRKIITVENPSALTHLAIEITKLTDAGKHKTLVLDSISRILEFQSNETVERFAHYLANKLRSMKISEIILISTSEKSDLILPAIASQCDQTFRV
jgi:KaiC/GvpD/RAD55 family RecA-like ATPase